MDDTKKPEGDNSVAKEMLRNMAAAKDDARAQMERAVSEQRRRLILMASGVFLSGVITGALFYGFVKYRWPDSGAHGDHPENSTEN